MSIVLDGTTGITAPAVTGPIDAANLTGVLPAIDGSALTGINGTPIGAVVHFAASAAPAGFIKANGASLSTTTYAALFAVIGYTFGGSGASFNLPDLRGEFLRGWDDARGVDSGRGFGSAQLDAFQGHRHSYVYWGPPGGGGGQSGVLSYTGGTTGDPVAGIDGTPRTSSETRPRNVALLACIKY